MQRFSSCLLALTVYLLVLDGRRLLDFFVLNQPTGPRPQPAPPLHSRQLRVALKAGWVTLALVYSFAYIALGDSRPTPVMGAWAVDVNGSEPPVPWRVIYFERGLRDSSPGSIRREDGAKPERFRYEFDAATRRIRIAFLTAASTERSFDGSYEVQDDCRIRLRGVLDGKAVDLQLVQKR